MSKKIKRLKFFNFKRIIKSIFFVGFILPLVYSSVLYGSDLKYSVFFNYPPSNDAVDIELVTLITQAKTTIDCAFYEGNRTIIINAFKIAADKGVTIRIATDDKSLSGSILPTLNGYNSGKITVKAGNTIGIMHNKYAVFDYNVAISPIRNYVWTKNPVYPLYQTFFGRLNSGPVQTVQDEGDNSIMQPKKDNRGKEWSHFAIRRIIYNESLMQTVLVPVRIFFEGEDNNPKYFDGKLSPFLFILPFFAFLRIKQDNAVIRLEKKILLLFSILFILFAFVKTDMRIRYIAPVIPPLVMLSSLGLHNIFSLLSARFSVLSGGILSFCFFFFFAVIISINGIYVFQQFRLVNPVGYLRGDIGRDEYIEKYRPEYAAIKYANNNLSKDAKILCFFLGNRRYYSDREMLFDVTILKNSLKRSDKPEIIVSDMKKKGITHLIIWYDMFNKWANNNFNEDERVLLDRFFKENTALLFSKGGHGLYELGAVTK